MEVHKKKMKRAGGYRIGFLQLYYNVICGFLYENH